MYHIGGNSYQLVKDHKNAWNFEVFRERYSEVLDRYDYIVGDWGYNQLRLRGFFKEANNKGSKDASISHLHDYLNEYCNFGCAYFIVEKQPAKKGQPVQGADGEELEAEPQADEAPQEEPVISAVAEPAASSDLKPRQHYHRAGTENRHKAAQERWGDGRGIPSEWKAKVQEAKKAEEGRGGEQRPRAQDSRPRGDADSRPNRGPEGGGGRPRHQDSRPRGQQRDGEGRPQEPRQRDPGDRSRGGDQPHGRDGERRGGGGGGGPNGGNGRERDRKPQVQTHAAGGEHKGRGGGGGSGNSGGPREQQQAQQGGGRGKPHDRPRNRDRDRDRDRSRDRDRDANKEKAEPLA
ncbi:YutD-like domain-containing protein [Gorillibacterium sp. sgz5001074]|uniref:YutD family protein n=1 Tax=Gorillibacterium sp. sgz5001074 TaxID=3446695 RepID=UPI003F667CB5